MAWREGYREASFRGVPFHVEAHELEFGRRTVTHEFPSSEAPPFVEDLGRSTRRYAVEAFVFGEDYMLQRDDLLAALDEPGDGELVHPYFGTCTVTVTGARLHESTAEGGTARFSVVFTQTGEAVQPSGEDATEELVIEQCERTELAVQAEFSAVFSIKGVPAFVVTAAAQIVSQVCDKLQALTTLLPPQVDALGAFLPALADAKANIGPLLAAPAELGPRITGLVGDLVNLPKASAGLTGDTGLKIARQLFDFGADLPAVPMTTPSRQRQAANQDALLGLVRKAATVAATRASAGMSFPSFAEAVRVRDELEQQLDTQAERSTVDDSHFSLVDLRAAMVRDIGARGADLARTVSVQTQQSQPSLVMAYNLYGDAAREAELAARNKSRHPGFMAAGRALEVLVDA